MIALMSLPLSMLGRTGQNFSFFFCQQHKLKNGSTFLTPFLYDRLSGCSICISSVKYLFLLLVHLKKFIYDFNFQKLLTYCDIITYYDINLLFVNICSKFSLPVWLFHHCFSFNIFLFKKSFICNSRNLDWIFLTFCHICFILFLLKYFKGNYRY
jgi:hypothetical protein